MAIDPSIPLGIRPPNVPDFTTTLGNLLQLQAFGQQMQAQRVQVQQRERALAADAAVRRAMQARGGDIDGALDDLERGGFGPEAFGMREQLIERRKKFADQQIAEADGLRKKMEMGAGIVAGITGPENFAVNRRALEAVVGPQLAGYIGDQWDPSKTPELLKNAMRWGRTQQDQITADRDAATAANAALTREQTARRDAHTLEKERPSIISEWTKGISLSLGNARDAEDYAKRRDTFAKGGPLALEALSQFDADYSPAATEKARALGISPEKQAELAGQAAGRAETRRHNLAMEGQGQQRIGIDNEQLGLARRQLALAEGNPEERAALADMVLRDPLILDKLTPSERGRTMKFIASQRGDGAFQSKANQSTMLMVDQALALVDELESRMTVMGGGSGAVGVKGPTSLFGLFEKPIAGSSAAGFAEKFEALKAQLSLPKLEVMRGLGQMSDREFQAVAKSATSLSRNMSDSEFLAELPKIRKGLMETRQRVQPSTPAQAGGGGTVQMRTPDGRIVPIPLDKVAEAERRGAKKVQ